MIVTKLTDNCFKIEAASGKQLVYQDHSAILGTLAYTSQPSLICELSEQEAQAIALNLTAIPS